MIHRKLFICVMSVHITSKVWSIEPPKSALLIINQGAECYFNGVLQALVSEKTIARHLINTPYKPSSLGAELQSLTTTYALTSQVNTEKPAYIGADALTKKLFNVNPQLQPGWEEKIAVDKAEKEAAKKKVPFNRTQFISNYRNRPEYTGHQSNPQAVLPTLLPSITTDSIEYYNNPFLIHYNRIARCTGCGKSTYLETDKNHYFLKIADECNSKTVQELFSRTSKTKCPLKECSATSALSKMEIETLPDCLIIDTNDPENPYKFSLTISLDPSTILIKEKSKKQEEYILWCIIMRTSAGGIGGHYYSLVQFENTWYVCDEPEEDWYGERDKESVERSQLKLKDQNLIKTIAMNGQFKRNKKDLFDQPIFDKPAMLFYHKTNFKQIKKAPFNRGLSRLETFNQNLSLIKLIHTD